MSDLDEAESLVSTWLGPLDDESAPCGPDLEYDAAFLELTQSAAGKPETQFGPGEPPDWRAVQRQAEALLERSRDLRLATFWLRGSLYLNGYSALLPGLRLINGMLTSLWDQVHPQPDPDDGDPYARANALALLGRGEGLITDLRACAVLRDRAVGQVSGREIELACGLSQPVGEEAAPARDQLARMFAAAVENDAGLREHALGCVTAIAELQSTLGERFNSSDAPDLALLLAFVKAVASLMPREDAGGGDDGSGGEGGDAGESGHAGGGPGLSGAVRSREEALRAIDMVCEYLERTEPSNPAPLFLRRAQQLVNHNFLQLMKELAPTLMPEVARIVGIDPDSV